mmetsp:Transcript_1135/g.1673  ORF Transcript_1135/g.1673 Transcript_1135/m.1673 type:complete len:500 (+) Transcript_1135:33-1532(+)
MEVLPGQLTWGPSSAGANSSSVNAIELGDCSKYYVQHYSVAALGQAFGPFALDQVFVFCRRLKALLVSRSFGRQPPVHLTYRSDDAEEHANSCVLLGAYLVLIQGWSSSQIVKLLGKQAAEQTFMCSWQKYCRKVMPVLACWEGLEVAVEHGWINTDCLNDDVFTDFACSKFRSMVATFDASWLVPGKLMVAADPSTTVHDPNPATFSLLWSEAKADLPRNTSKGSLHSRNLVPADRKTNRVQAVGGDCDCIDDDDAATDSTETPQCLQSVLIGSPMVTDFTDDSKQPLNYAPGQVIGLDDGASSVETVCKEYLHPVTMNDKERPQQTKTFSDFLQECDVKLMVRCNFTCEQGMPKMGYSADQLKHYGIAHKDIQFLDKDGGLPARSHVAEILREGSSLMERDAGAMLVHCKGGFGRSVVLACCLAIHTYNIPGRALLGWVRIARPGAITTVLQEEFLMSLKGRDDVARFAGARPSSAANRQNMDDAARTKCHAGCMVM